MKIINNLKSVFVSVYGELTVLTKGKDTRFTKSENKLAKSFSNDFEPKIKPETDSLVKI